MLLVLGDSTCFHGPEQAVLLTEERLWPNVAACEVSTRAEIVAGAGWMSRDGWWSVSRDPRVWTILADPSLQAVVLALGSMDQLPASVPIWWRESIRYLRPTTVRRRVRSGYHTAHPYVVRATGGSVRQLAQPATNHYLTRIRDAIEHYRPGLPVVHPGPTPWRSDAYPIGRSHPDAVRAAAAWADRNDCRFLDLDPLVGPMHEAGAGNPDGLHWNWPTHRSVGLAVGQALAEVIR